MPGMELTQGLALQQTLSPQMQQSLQLLQAPLLELRQLVTAELAANPVLEEELPPSRETGKESEAPEPPTSQREEEWNEYYVQREPWTPEAGERWQYFLDSQTRPPTLQQHLLTEIGHFNLDPRQRGLALSVTGNIDDHGYLRASDEEIAAQAGTSVSEAAAMVRRVQTLDPPGVGARNLAECLLLQLDRRDGSHELARQIVAHHLENLGRRKYALIARDLNVPVTEVQKAARTISQLEPRPGRPFSSGEEQTVLPDVQVAWDGDDLVVSLNEGELPALRIGSTYKDLLAEPGANGEVRNYLRDRIRSGRFFLRCIEQRQQTLLHISREIVAHQRPFFELGTGHLQPLTMSRIAEAVGVHETTVSRAVAGKYMTTPRGLFELKYFFTSGYTTESGDSVSNESVRQAIAEMIRTEPPESPLSDHALHLRLAAKGWPIARRTVAKYREQLAIPPSHLRKSF